MVSKSKLIDAKDLPSTVGVFCWKSKDSKTLFFDLVNYNLDTDRDAVQPAENLRFKMRLSKGYKNAKIDTISPDNGSSATIEIKDNWAIVHLGRLTYFASIKLTMQE